MILLQLSKVEPTELVKELDGSTTMLLAASRAHETEMDTEAYELKSPVIEGPSGMGMAEAVGTIGRAISVRVTGSRRGSAASSHPMEPRRQRMGHPGAMGSGVSERGGSALGMHPLARHQLYDAPMPYDAEDKVSMHSGGRSPAPTSPTGEGGGARHFSALKFSSHDTTHLYNPKAGGKGGAGAVHGTRQASRDRVDSHPSPLSPRTADVADAAFTPNVGGFSPGASPATSFDTTQAFPSATPRGSVAGPGHEAQASVSTAARYRDPYAGGRGEGLVSPRSGAVGTFPTGEGGLADQLRHEFAATPPADRDAPTSPTNASAGGHKFSLPFASRERTQSGASLGIGGGRRVPIPHGHHKADQSLDRLETEGLMSADVEGEEEEGDRREASEEGFGELGMVESRDAVGAGDYRGRGEE